MAERQALTNELVERCRKAEAGARELEAMIGAEEADRHVVRRASAISRRPRPSVEVFDAAPAPIGAGGDPNSWEQGAGGRPPISDALDRADIPLAGKTVLEYGCGNAAVSCAFAERPGA